MWVYLPYIPRLPNTYQEVEYIQSSWTQYINTWISAPNWFKAILKVGMVTAGGASQTIIGSHNLNSPYGRNNINVFTSGNTWGLHMNNEMINSLWSVVIWKVYEVDGSTILWASYLDVDGVKLTTGSNTSPMSSNNILIFTNQYEINAHSTFVSAKLYSCMLYNSSYELVRDFVPCYRKSDNVIGLYDLVNNQFYTNSWTGTFSKWADVTMAELKNAYIGEYWSPNANTVAYYPFKDDQLDVTWNTTLTYTNWTKQSVWFYYDNTDNLINWLGSTPRFVSYWAKVNWRHSGTSGAYLCWIPLWWVVYYYINWGSGTPYQYTIQYRNWESSWTQSPSTYPITNNTWYNFAYGIDGSNIVFYLNWEKKADFTYSGTLYDEGAASIGSNVKIYIADLIYETKCWTAQEVASYYNKTKSTYWL